MGVVQCCSGQLLVGVVGLLLSLFLSTSGVSANPHQLAPLTSELLNLTEDAVPPSSDNLTNPGGGVMWSAPAQETVTTDVMWDYLQEGRRSAVVPDEQRLYENLMMGYESSVRPVINASRTIMVSFKLTLNQIIDLDERKQVLTTNVFIDQEWEDENLKWNADHYNGIRTLRVPASYVWLPDTFIFNNADDGSTGFMQGVYVSLNFTGTVLWPVPVKLKSSCKVDITYFPFDDQKCILRFGSWIYSGEWMDFRSSIEDVDLSYYIDNSEWELLSITFQKGVRKYACCPEPHPDLTYTLHIRRRTFFYIFNIIVPCVMLSVLTLLTFWLPTTCGEKISLGLSVFLAFSMFMLLIAEEVPATSESVPLIGIYLTTVMTMTSLSVVMAVLVINIYNRGSKARRAPRWIKVLVLNWICRMLRMSHDIERLAQTIKLSNEEEERYECEAHSYQKLQAEVPPVDQIADPLRSMGGTPSSPAMTLSPSDSDLDDLSRRFTRYQPHLVSTSQREALVHRNRNGIQPSVSGLQNVAMTPDPPEHPLAGTCAAAGASSGVLEEEEEEEEPVWLPRDLSRETNSASSSSGGGGGDRVRFHVRDDIEEMTSRRHAYNADNGGCCRTEAEVAVLPTLNDDSFHHPRHLTRQRPTQSDTARMRRKQETISNLVADSCQKEKALISRKEMVVEWQTIATVIDRLLFWIFLLGTIVAYIVILIVVPGSKPTYTDDILPIHLLKRNS